MRCPFRRRIRGLPDAVGRGVPRRLSSKHPLQKRSRFGELACAGKTGRLKHVAVSVVHLQSFLTSETGQASSRGGLIRLPVGIVVRELMASAELPEDRVSYVGDGKLSPNPVNESSLDFRAGV